MAEYKPSPPHKEEQQATRYLDWAKSSLGQGLWCDTAWGLREALRLNPMHKEALLSLDQLLSVLGEDATVFFSLEGTQHELIDVALHAYALGYSGARNEALRLLCELSSLVPSRPLLPWAWRWLHNKEEAMGLDAALLHERLSTLIENCEEEPQASVRLWPDILALANLMNRAYPASKAWLYLRAEAAIETGAVSLAWKLALDLQQTGNHAEASLCMARLCELDNQPKEAAQHYEDALLVHPTNHRVYCALILHLLNKQRWEDAEWHLKQILLEDPYCPRALALFFLVSYHKERSDLWKQKMASLTRAYPHEKTLQSVYRRFGA